jgi:hypothetical protein
MFAGAAARVSLPEPLVDTGSVRQSDVAMISRNFYAHGFWVNSVELHQEFFLV